MQVQVSIIQGRNELLDILLSELNTKESVLLDDSGRVSKKYDGEKTHVYKYED